MWRQGEMDIPIVTPHSHSAAYPHTHQLKKTRSELIDHRKNNIINSINMKSNLVCVTRLFRARHFRADFSPRDISAPTFPRTTFPRSNFSAH